jgi:predicted amidohydrolase YtcJ
MISKNANGELTGELFDNAMDLVTLPPRAPLSTADIVLTQQVANRYGITSVRIPGAYKGTLLDAYHLMQKTRDAGQLSLRYTIYLPGFDLASAADARALLSEWKVKQDEGDNWVRIGGVKLMIDGGFEGGHMSEPYKEPWGKGGTYAGVTTVPPGPYTEVVRELNRLGWRPTTHAVGDAGMDQVLAAYEAANAEQPIAGKRWAIEHAFIARPEQIARLKALDIALSVQDHLYIVAPVLKKYWGAERASQVTPLKSYLDAGLLVAGGTDSYVIPLNPLWQLYHFHTRDTVSDGRYGENQAVPSREELLKLITINYARLVGTERDLGSIELGKLADFVILSGDFLTVAPEQMRDLKALATYVGGKEAYRDASWK